MKKLCLLSGMIVLGFAGIKASQKLTEEQRQKIEQVQWGKIGRQQDLARPSVYKMLDALIVGKEKNIDWPVVFALLDSMQGVIGVHDYFTPQVGSEYDEFSLLALACDTNNLLAAKTLLEKYKVNPNRDPYTPLMLACEKGYLAMVGLLLKHGANPSQKDPEGKNSFVYAKGKPAILDLLYKYTSPAAAA